MAHEQAVNAERSGNDLWVAVGVVVCLGLGAGVTYWLTGESQPPTPAKPLELKGAVMGEAPKTSATQVKDPKAADVSKTPPAPEKIQTDGGDEYLSLTFDTLGSYLYTIEDADEPIVKTEKRPKDQIPAPIKALDGKKIAIKGFMVADVQQNGALKTFMLVRDQSLCCYGRWPRMNEWISVAMADGKTTRLVRDQPVTIFGTLHVGEYKEKGVVLSVYRFDAVDVAGPLDL